jgi:hypothetical protein
MATSGTHDFNLDLGDLIEEAFERIGSEARTGYHYRTARRSLDLLLLEWQNKGLNLWTIKTASQALTAGTASYTLSGEKLDIIDAVIRTNDGDTARQADQYIQRISFSNYTRQTNKLSSGKPTQYTISRTPEAITVTLWPVPDASTTYTMFYSYMERIEDSGKPASLTVDVPARHLPCLTAGLAYYLSMKINGSEGKTAMLKQIYDEQWNLAADSTREKASFFLKPGGYRV